MTSEPRGSPTTADAERVVPVAKDGQAVGHRAGAKIRPAGGDDAGGLAAGVGVDHRDALQCSAPFGGGGDDPEIRRHVLLFHRVNDDILLTEFEARSRPCRHVFTQGGGADLPVFAIDPAVDQSACTITRL